MSTRNKARGVTLANSERTSTMQGASRHRTGPGPVCLSVRSVPGRTKRRFHSPAATRSAASLAAAALPHSVPTQPLAPPAPPASARLAEATAAAAAARWVQMRRSRSRIRLSASSSARRGPGHALLLLRVICQGHVSGSCVICQGQCEGQGLLVHPPFRV